MSADFTTVYPNSGGEPWEASCDHCGERIDLDHWADIEAHDEKHRRDAEISAAMRDVMVEELAEAQMRGYKDGLRKGILLAEHFTGRDLTALRNAVHNASVMPD